MFRSILDTRCSFTPTGLAFAGNTTPFYLYLDFEGVIVLGVFSDFTKVHSPWGTKSLLSLRF